VKTNGEDSRKSGVPPELAHDTLACAAIVRVYLEGAVEEGGGTVNIALIYALTGMLANTPVSIKRMRRR